MTNPSPASLPVLHGVRLLGFADSSAIAERAGVGHQQASEELEHAARLGWVRHDGFAGLDGWSLTDDGRAENERQLANQLAGADPRGVVRAVHGDFLPLNARLVQACTDWQLKPTAEDRLSPNRHTDPAWDGRILDELAALSSALTPLVRHLTTVLPRFTGYDTRFDAALRRARSGQHEWVDRTDVDSCHRVWFQLHEDLIATLGIDRGTQI